MSQLILCSAQFSEARQKEVVEAIASAISAVDGVSMLDVDPNPSGNRTVFSFVGSPGRVIEGALNGARAACQLIDMTRQEIGDLPRLGSLDEVPFTPVSNATMQDCWECSNIFGSKLAEEIGVPVYLYGSQVTQAHRKLVSQFREMEYENLDENIKQSQWVPDFGPAEFVPHWGATLTGPKKFVVAMNVNILATKEQAHRIALDVRESGRGDDQPGKLKHVQGIGWYLDEFNVAQVTLNITDVDETPLHTVFEEVAKVAESLQLGVVGCQIIGTIPMQYILSTADYYIEKEGIFILEEDQKIRLVIQRLGLNSLTPFNPKEKIIDMVVGDGDQDGPLLSMDLREFVLTVGSRNPAPGGGSVAALVGALGAALGTMSALLTFGNKKFETLDGQIRRLLPPLYNSTRDLLPAVDEDALVFNEYLKLTKIHTEDEEDEANRKAVEQRILQHCIHIPLALAKRIDAVWSMLRELAEIGNIACKSDMQIATRCLHTAVWSVYYNVSNLLLNLQNTEESKSVQSEIESLAKAADAKSEEIFRILSQRHE